jgi:myo-inositol-1-phosphate synthase
MGNNVKRVRVAIISIGNCVSPLIPGVNFYKDTKNGENVIGIMHVKLGGYPIRIIEFTTA